MRANVKRHGDDPIRTRASMQISSVRLGGPHVPRIVIAQTGHGLRKFAIEIKPFPVHVQMTLVDSAEWVNLHFSHLPGVSK